jgi:hypothetical protein
MVQRLWFREMVAMKMVLGTAIVKMVQINGETKFFKETVQVKCFNKKKFK